MPVDKFGRNGHRATPVYIVDKFGRKGDRATPVYIGNKYNKFNKYFSKKRWW